MAHRTAKGRHPGEGFASGAAASDAFGAASAGVVNALNSGGSLGAEIARTGYSQLALSGEWLQKLASCRTPAEVMQLNLSYVQKSMALQSDEWRRLLEIGMNGLPHVATPKPRD